ncbi:hypothetical protein [Enorma phocaeensis]|uniref:hypothetical protein n=1 Tax=Enorma phocaeensis TaxID=1871019 RepID=UPI0011AEF969|nr:hypothetical protein [Enorma phocaeensis]
MSVESSFLLKEVSDGLMVIGCNEKTTLFNKLECPGDLVDQLQGILWRNDPPEVAALVARLAAISQQGGWGNAPTAYFLRHHGWTLMPAIGTAGDIQLVIRSGRSLNRM